MGGRGGASPAIERVQGPRTRQAPAPAGPSAAELPSLIRQVYGVLTQRGEWLNIADLRDRFTNGNSPEFDQAIRALEQQPDVNVVPMANERALNQRTRDGSVRIGGEAKHFIAIGV